MTDRVPSGVGSGGNSAAATTLAGDHAGNWIETRTAYEQVKQSLMRFRKTRRRQGINRTLKGKRGQLESLEPRHLLAGDLVGQWIADDLKAQLADGDAVTDWADATTGLPATSIGTPVYAADQLGGRGVVRFDASDGDDVLVVSRDDSPASGADDFSVVIAFATDNANFAGTNGQWYENTGIVDGSNLGIARDWGISINSTGQLSAGISGGLGGSPVTVYSTSSGLNDGQLHIATFTRSGGEISLYVDSLSAVTRTDGDSASRAVLGFSIGRLFSNQRPFTGDVAEVRFYDGALDSSEVATISGELQSFYNNSVPVPVDDQYTLAEDASFFLVAAPGILGNDIDVDGDSLTAQLVDAPSNGDLALQPNGSFVYNAQKDYFGPDSFTYRAIDFRGSQVLGTVTFDITPVYDAAAGVADSYKAVPTQALTVDAASGVLANDVNIDQASLTAVLEGVVTVGQLTLNADGSFQYDPQGFSGSATFTYRVDDQTQLSSPTTVTLIVNTSPTSVADAYVVPEDIALTIDALAGVIANDSDTDGDALTVSIAAAPAHGLVTLNDDGSFTYVSDTDYFGQDLFSYQLTDGVDTSAPTLVQLTIQSVNDAPAAGDDFYFTLPGNTLAISPQFGLLLNDSDVETTTLEAALAVSPSNGTLDLAADGSFTYTPNAGFTGTDTFTYRASDGEAESELATVSLTITPRPIVLSEIMASNADTITTMLRDLPTDEFVGEVLSPDWIELRNILSQPIDVGGLHLTDSRADSTKWQFPQGTIIPASGYLTVFASGTDIQDPSLDQQGWLHTNFQLDPDGEYLAITGPSGEVIDQLDSYPTQRTHISYGIGDDGIAQYYIDPTPGAANAAGLAGLVQDTRFSVNRGFYTDPFELTISSATDGATIRYTTDGTVPTETTGTVYSGPLTIAETTTVRARAFQDDMVSTNTDTNSYLFIADIVQQDSQATLDAGFPARWRNTTADYGLDSDDQLPLIAGDASMSVDEARAAIQNSLLSIPTLSIVMNVDDMFGDQGIYANPERAGVSWERPTSFELIQPDGTEGFQIDSGIRIQGGAFRGFGLTKKKSFRLLFKTTYGPSKLEYPLFGGDAVDQFDTLTLRMESNDGWQWGGANGQPQYARDEFFRRTQLAMGQPASHGKNYHLYINGMYWGMYNAVERPDQSFGEAYFGSDPYSWDGQNSGIPINAKGDTFRTRRTRDAWKELTSAAGDIRSAGTEESKTDIYMAVQGRNPDGSRNPELPKYLDPENYADYLIANYYGGNADWPRKNYYLGRENSDDSDGFKFFMWDAEWSLFLRSNQSAGLLNDSQGVALPFRGLKTSQEFRLLFADRVQKHLFNGGALYVDPQNPNWDPARPDRNVPAARYVEFTDTIYDALIAESARWGDQHRGRPYTRDADWQPEFDRIMTRWFPTRTFDLLRIFKTLDLYPQTDTPTFSQRGGPIEADTNIALAAGAGTIYYTLDGSDPRVVGGGVSATAIEYTGAFQLSDSGTVSVRALNGADWSAIDTADYLVGLVPASSDNLRVAEVHYNPGPSTPAEAAAGFDDKDEFEFIELVNISNQTVDLTEVRLVQVAVGAARQGVDFDFAQAAIQQLDPGQRVLVVENEAAFAFRYGNSLPVAGQWSGGLSNNSEMITVNASDATLQQFVYDDQWHPATDGGGASLEYTDVNSANLDGWSQAANWRPSGLQGGTPGQSANVQIPGDSNRDGVFNSNDLVAVFAAGEYEDAIVGNSTFEEGDWDGDGDFSTADLVFVFAQGNYVANAVAPVARSSTEFAAARAASAVVDLDVADTQAIGLADVLDDPSMKQTTVRRRASQDSYRRDLIFSQWDNDRATLQDDGQVDETPSLLDDVLEDIRRADSVS